MFITTDTYAIEKEVRSFCANHGLTVEYTEDGNTYTEDNTIYIRKPDPRWDKDAWLQWKFTVYHEIGHNVAEMSDVFPMMERNKVSPDSFLGALVNGADDYRSEYYRFDEYHGRRQIMSEARRKWTETLISSLSSPSDMKDKALQTMLIYDTIKRENWQKDMAGLPDKMLDGADLQQQEWLNRLEDGEYWEHLQKPCSAEAMYQLMKAIIDNVFDMDSEEEEKSSQEQYEQEHGKAGGEGEPQAGENEGKGDESEGVGEEKEGDGTSNEMGSEGSEIRKAEATVKYDYNKYVMHDHGKPEGATYTPLHIEYPDKFAGGYYNPATLADFDIRDYTKMHGATTSSYYDRIRKVKTGRGLSTRVRKLLQVISQSHYQHGMKRGRLSTKNIYRCTMTETGSYQEKIFKKQITNDVLDTAVLVLTDMSGSMGGQKIVHAGKATAMLNEAIGRLHIPLKIVGFTETRNTVRHNVFKNFDSKITEDNLLRNFAQAAHDCMHNNADGDSVLWGYQQLLSRPEKRKLLIVLSDGSPAGYRGDGDSYTKNVVSQIEKEKRVEIYGIGIMDRNVQRYYTNNKVIEKADELETALLNVIKSKVINR